MAQTATRSTRPIQRSIAILAFGFSCVHTDIASSEVVNKGKHNLSIDDIKQEPSKVQIHNRTKIFIDIEAPKDQTWIGCHKDRPKTVNSYMVFYILNGDETHWFLYRRPLTVSQCLKVEKEYLGMAKNAKTIRVVGRLIQEEKRPQSLEGERVPARFGQVKKHTSWIFHRFQVENKCKAYFEDDCDLPKNYWANTIPYYNGK